MIESNHIQTPRYQAFWSYVHMDDQAEGGRIVDLATDVRNQYGLISAESLQIFVDREGIDWGDWWRDQVATGLASALFIAILTPRYFLSTECRNELHTFIRSATDLGVRELVLPILYIDVPSLHEDKPDDELIALVKALQWVNWTDLRFVDRTEGMYRKAVAGLAERLLRANREIEGRWATNESREAVATERAQANGPEEEDGTPGLIDKLNEAEIAMNEIPNLLTDVTSEIEQVGQRVAAAASETRKATAFSQRIVIAKRLAHDLEEQAKRVLLLGNQYTERLYEFDVGIRLLFDLASEEVRREPSEMKNVCSFIASLRELSKAADRGMAQAEAFATQIEATERLSRDLRPVMRTLRKGITLFIEGRDVIASWVQLADDSGIDCSSV